MSVPGYRAHQRNLRAAVPEVLKSPDLPEHQAAFVIPTLVRRPHEIATDLSVRKEELSGNLGMAKESVNRALGVSHSAGVPWAT